MGLAKDFGILAPVESNSRAFGTESRGGISNPGKRSINKAIKKLKRKLNRMKMKIQKKKLLTELGVKVNKLRHKDLVFSSCCLSSHDI